MIELHEPTKVPKTQWSKFFLQGMINRMAFGFFRYGDVTKSHEDWIKRLKNSINHYHKTGNTEFMLDAANYCMCEFQFPTHSKAHFTCSDSQGTRKKI